VIKRVRDLAVRCAGQYLDSRRELGFPLLEVANAEYFFELLTEEIPPGCSIVLTDLESSLTMIARRSARARRSRSPATAAAHRVRPRRPARPPARPCRDREGPAKEGAYDAAGNPTQALNGFLKKNAAATGTSSTAVTTFSSAATSPPEREEILSERVPQTIEGSAGRR